MKDYRKAQAIINNQFPELMELKEGCEVDVSEIPDTGNGVFFLSRSITVADRVVGDSEIRLVECGMDTFNIDDILGQPITLQSLLRILSKDECIKFIFRDDTLEIERLPSDDIYIEIDLSKPPQEWGKEKWKEILEIL